MLNPGTGRTKTGQLWAYARDDRPWGGADPPMVAYVYATDRKGERAEAHLGDFAGILQVDGYGGYTALAKRRQLIQLAFCWSHVRRKLYELADKSPVATEVLRRIAMLYAIEDEVRGTSAEQRRAVRAERACVVVDDLHVYLEARLRQVSAKSKLGDAIRYALTRWPGQSLFIDDGRVALYSNTIERSIRPLALNRKNALFAGSDEGGDNWAVIAMLIENCKITGIDPHAWLIETLAKLASGHPANTVGQLMPWTAVAGEHRLHLEPERLVFIDETWTATNMTRGHGRCRKGERLRMDFPHGHRKNTKLVAGLRMTGMVAPMVPDGPINRDWFEAYLDQVLVPELRPGDVVIMDNIAGHKRAAVKERIEAASATLRFLPPNSPDFNPNEKAFSRLKAMLRKVGDRTVSGLWDLIGSSSQTNVPTTSNHAATNRNDRRPLSTSLSTPPGGAPRDT